MLNSHSKAGIALIAFYLPTVIIARQLIFHRRPLKRLPRLAWIVLLVFCIGSYTQLHDKCSWLKLTRTVRLASGIVVLLHGIYPDSTGLTVASIILLNIGVFPIIAATIGLVQIMYATLGTEWCELTFPTMNSLTRYSKFMDFSESKTLHYGIAFSRVLFITGVGLLVAGGVLEGMANPSSVETGLQLVEAGYIIVAAFVGCLFGFETFFWTHHARLSHPSRTVSVVLVGIVLQVLTI
jgi:hypothetical protein